MIKKNVTGIEYTPIYRDGCIVDYRMRISYAPAYVVESDGAVGSTRPARIPTAGKDTAATPS